MQRYNVYRVATDVGVAFIQAESLEKAVEIAEREWPVEDGDNQSESK